MNTAIKEFSSVNIAERQSMDIRPGDTIRVWERVTEGEKTRLQAFEGLVIARKHGREAGGTFIVRKIASGVGVERTYFLYSPLVEKIELIRRSKVRRAKLYYIRTRAARETRHKMKAMRAVNKMIADESAAPTTETAEETEADAPAKEQETKNKSAAATHKNS
ncbi:MAG: 50S ribosomal protein L19 [Parcubacteria group bacterium]|nr:50S ribosomal protein L19 [Parcubacteria group bacterium]